MTRFLGSWSMCKWMARGLPICSVCKQGLQGLGQDTAYVIWAHMEEAFSEWTLHSTHFAISLLPLVEAWWQAVAASNHQRLGSQAENPTPRIPVVTTGELDSLVQLVGVHPSKLGDQPQ